MESGIMINRRPIGIVVAVALRAALVGTAAMVGAITVNGTGTNAGGELRGCYP
jgi:hypothetical protein